MIGRSWDSPSSLSVGTLLFVTNLQMVYWNTGTTPSGREDTQYQILEATRDCYLYQHIQVHTRGRGADKPISIDLVFSNEEEIVKDIKVGAPLGKSDHTVIELKIDTAIHET